MIADFLIKRRPVSVQTKSNRNLQAWKDFVRAEASKSWSDDPILCGDIHLSMVYLYDINPIDVDNIIKPIQDALVGLVYQDDLLVTDIDSHRRSLTGTFDPLILPQKLLAGVMSGEECVYICVRNSKDIGDFL